MVDGAGVGRINEGGVDLFEEALDELGVPGVVDEVHDPAALPAHPAAADVEDLDGGLELVADQGEDVGVGRVGKDDGVALDDLAQCGGVVTQAGGLLEIEGGGSRLHLSLDLAQVGAGATGHEGAEVLSQRPMVLRADAAHAGGRALVDVPQQAGAPRGLGTAEDAGRAGTHREDPQQLLDGLTDGPGLDEGTEVAGSRFAGPTDHLDAGVGLPHRHRQVGVGLVVLVHDVETGVELLDPGVLQGQGLHLGGHDRPFHRACGGDHLLGARVQCGEVLEVVGQTLTQVLGLADVDDPSLPVQEPVDPRGRGDLARGRTVRRGVGHARKRRRPSSSSTTRGPAAGRRCTQPENNEGPEPIGLGSSSWWWAILGSNQ